LEATWNTGISKERRLGNKRPLWLRDMHGHLIQIVERIEKRPPSMDLGCARAASSWRYQLGVRSGHSGCVLLSVSRAKMHAQSRFLPLIHESESVRGLGVQRMLVNQCLAGRLMTMLDERGASLVLDRRAWGTHYALKQPELVDWLKLAHVATLVHGALGLTRRTHKLQSWRSLSATPSRPLTGV
jgi:hypothetical protein